MEIKLRRTGPFVERNRRLQNHHPKFKFVRSFASFRICITSFSKLHHSSFYLSSNITLKQTDTHAPLKRVFIIVWQASLLLIETALVQKREK